MSVASSSLFGLAPVAWLFVAFLALLVVSVLGGAVAASIATRREARLVEMHASPSHVFSVGGATPLSLPGPRA